MTDLQALLAVARGDRPADLLLDRCRLVDLATGTVRETSVAIARGRIAGWGPAYEAEQVVDLDGLHLAPGLIDAHVHIESSLVVPSEFARAVVPRGVTTVVTDPHEIANVAGLDGIRRMIEDSQRVPLDVRVNASSCVPASPLGSGGAELDADDLASLLSEPSVLGLAEVMNFPGVVAGAPEVLAKIDAFRGRPVDGHSPGLTGQALAAYVAAGIESDHECVTAAEARERLELGMTVFLREATNARNLRDLLPVVDRWTESRVCLATDDRVPADLLDEGSIDHMVRVAIEEGIEPLVALAMGSTNTARHFRLGDRGLVAPGRRADLWAFEDLRSPRAEAVWIEGVLVAAGGEAKWSREAGEVRDEATVHLASGALEPESFRIEAPGSGPDAGNVRVIEAIPDQIVTGERIVEPRIEDGFVVADPERDLSKIVVLERHAASGRAGKGLVTGVGLRRGALAGTFAHDHHNLVVIGVDDRSMATAGRAVADAGGGLAAADGDRVLALLPLPFGGLMSRQPIEEVRRVMDDLLAAARDLGSMLHDPFMAMSFLTLEVIPKLKITDQGLVDVERFEVVGLGV